MNGFESRSSEAIVCGEEYNSVLTIMNMVHKDKSGKLQPQLIQEKLRIWINKFGYDPEDENESKINLIKYLKRYKNILMKNLRRELNREFTWPEGETIEDPIFERNEIQESHIAKLENENEIKNQLNEGLRGQLEETQTQLSETARRCN
ncbi:hypothetical protein RhiirA5_417432 [Rhizophagus irregularis]|nr:hypothetical protein RhiirA5_417432 [Rhizophagus irregularis]